jgi:hypothetical protein
MTRYRHAFLASSLFLLAGVSLGTTGCQALPSAASLDQAIAPQPPGIGQPPQTGATPNHCVVVLRDAGSSSSQRVNVDLEKETHIQDLLTRSGALRRYRRMDIQLIRTTPTGAKHRMGVDFDRASRKVAMQSDYAIQPGDVLLVEEDPTNTLDDMLGRSKKAKSTGRFTTMLGG